MENGSEVLIWLASFWALATIGIPFVIEFIYEKIAKPKTSLWKSIWSWTIPILGFYVAWFAGKLFDVGFLVEYEIWWVPGIMGAIAALIANLGWNNVPWLKVAIIEIIKLLPKTRKEE